MNMLVDVTSMAQVFCALTYPEFLGESGPILQTKPRAKGHGGE